MSVVGHGASNELWTEAKRNDSASLVGGLSFCFPPEDDGKKAALTCEEARCGEGWRQLQPCVVFVTKGGLPGRSDVLRREDDRMQTPARGERWGVEMGFKKRERRGG